MISPSTLLGMVWLFTFSSRVVLPYFLFSVVSAAALGALQGLVMARGRRGYRGAVIPVVAAVAWAAAFSASGLVGNLGALFVFGPSLFLWPIALIVGSVVGLWRKGRKS